MPPWAEEVCRRWRAILQLLEGPPESVRTTLDWAMKHALYADRLERRGISWESLSLRNGVLANLDAALRKLGPRREALSLDFLIGPHSPILEQMARLTPRLREQGLRWDRLENLSSLRRELCEIDTRFGQLGDHGIFRKLERAGLLAQHVPGVDNLEEAIANPPAVGRARLRGEAIGRLAAGKTPCRCDWQSVWDYSHKRVLDLADPFATKEQWRNLPARGEAADASLPRVLEVESCLRRLGVIGD